MLGRATLTTFFRQRAINAALFCTFTDQAALRIRFIFSKPDGMFGEPISIYLEET